MNVGLDEGDESENEDNMNSEVQKPKAEYIALNPFKELYPESDLVKLMKEFGSNIVPLSLIGLMMNYTGNHLLHYIYTVMKKRIFFPMHKVIQI